AVVDGDPRPGGGDRVQVEVGVKPVLEPAALVDAGDLGGDLPALVLVPDVGEVQGKPGGEPGQELGRRGPRLVEPGQAVDDVLDSVVGVVAVVDGHAVVDAGQDLLEDPQRGGQREGGRRGVLLPEDGGQILQVAAGFCHRRSARSDLDGDGVAEAGQLV